MKKDPTRSENQLGNLLERYRKIFKPPQASVERECIAVITEVCGITLLPHQIEYNVATRTLQLKTPSLLRSELKLKSELILTELAKRLDASTTPTTLL
jgi:hypothetical protein